MKKVLQRTLKLVSATQKKWARFQADLKEKERSRHPEPAEVVYQPELEMKNTMVDISVGSVTKGALAILAIAALAYFLYSIQAILVLVFVSLILAAAMDPVVDKWEKRGLRRGWSVIILYILFLTVLGMVVYALIPIMVEQTKNLIQTIGALVNNILSGENINFPFSTELRPFIDTFLKDIDQQQVTDQLQQFLSGISTQLGSIAGNSLAALAAIFNGIFNAILVMIMTFFMVTDRQAIYKFTASLIPSRYVPYMTVKMSQMQVKIGGWVRGQLLLCLTIGITTYVGLYILELFGINIQYKETLAVVAGVTEIIPYLGPVIGAIPALLIATNVSGWAVLGVLIIYIILQGLENNILVPMIMNKEVGLNPIIIIIAMLVGAQFFGILGILLAIPVATSIEVFVKDYLDKEK